MAATYISFVIKFSLEQNASSLVIWLEKFCSVSFHVFSKKFVVKTHDTTVRQSLQCRWKDKIFRKKLTLYLIVEVSLRAKASILKKQLFYIAVIDNNIC